MLDIYRLQVSVDLVIAITMGDERQTKPETGNESAAAARAHQKDQLAQLVKLATANEAAKDLSLIHI